MDKRQEATELVNKAKNIFLDDRSKIYSGLYLLKQVAILLDNEELLVWVNLELGDPILTRSVKKTLEDYVEYVKMKKKKEFIFPKTINGKPFDFKTFIDSGEATQKYSTSAGGFQSIEVVEKIYDTLPKKQSNNRVEHRKNLIEHLAIVRNIALEKTISIHEQLAYSDTLRDGFDFLKEQIDDKLLDLNPVAAEQLMLSFKSMNSQIAEERSQALTTARRFLKELADSIYPARSEKKGERKLGEEQYINRIWAFMDEAIESSSNKASAKSLVDLIGLNIQNLYKGTNKGVHDEVSATQSILFIFQIYIMVGYLLDYLSLPNSKKKRKLNINEASLDELESMLGITRKVAKEIIKFRVITGGITEWNLIEVNGVGKVTSDKAKEIFDF
ncbi:ComEA family DNA-binding protein [Listeria cossartiae]|uniref:ComEA family DNA-binding protein n=1 Tax=Listeria cossartiae TaxID=2838249 RepID=UPI0028805D38|nr:helix-hairpin-helix domain-containing protein [Listeria cossartiae]MDT0015130.1 helix-hairpin-helix domain-containing protein [Listeria cossartiae subsp. cayugensis]